MFKFFRKLRQQSVNRNRFSKYLIYAMGEIFLVVIGILIALQINAWNQERLNRQEEKVLLRNIANSLNTDLERLDACITETSKRMQRMDTTVQMLKNSDSLIPKVFISRALDFSLDAYFVCNSGIFDEAVSSGKMSLIQNQDLIEAIFDYYQKAKENYQDKSTQKATDEIIAPIVMETVIGSKDGISLFNPSVGSIAEIASLDLDALRSNAKFWNMFANKMGYNSYQLQIWSGRKKRIQAILISIEQEFN